MCLPLVRALVLYIHIYVYCNRASYMHYCRISLKIFRINELWFTCTQEKHTMLDFSILCVRHDHIRFPLEDNLLSYLLNPHNIFFLCYLYYWKCLWSVDQNKKTRLITAWNRLGFERPKQCPSNQIDQCKMCMCTHCHSMPLKIYGRLNWI